jgi:hypothetical protein
MLSNVCEVPWPIRSAEFMIVCGDLMFGVLIFATIVGNVGRCGLFLSSGFPFLIVKNYC